MALWGGQGLSQSTSRPYGTCFKKFLLLTLQDSQDTNATTGHVYQSLLYLWRPRIGPAMADTCLVGCLPPAE